MSRTLLVFGDSNSHGTPPIVTPGEYYRFDAAIRWPRVLARALGDDWCVVEEGLPGRTTQFDDPVMGAHMNGQTGLRIALESHGPLDLLVIMLGTNDAKTRFNPTPERIVAGLAGLGLGSIQSVARAGMARRIPAGQEAELFGFYALCGKSGAILGPLLFGTLSEWLGDQRPAVLALGAFFLVGWSILGRSPAASR